MNTFVWAWIFNAKLTRTAITAYSILIQHFQNFLNFRMRNCLIEIRDAKTDYDIIVYHFWSFKNVRSAEKYSTILDAYLFRGLQSISIFSAYSTSQILKTAFFSDFVFRNDKFLGI